MFCSCRATVFHFEVTRRQAFILSHSQSYSFMKFLYRFSWSWSGCEPGSSLQTWDVGEHSKHTFSCLILLFYFSFWLGAHTPVVTISGCIHHVCSLFLGLSTSLFLRLLSKVAFGKVGIIELFLDV